MSKERITDDLLSANFADGDILYGEDINKIIRILKAASNITKTEIDSILSSEKEFIFRTYEEATTYAYNNIVEEGQFCLIIENGLAIYKYINNIWEIVEKFSLIDLYQRAVEIDADDIPFDGSGTNYLVGETEVESAVKELDTRVKTNADDIALKVNTSDIADNLTTDDATRVLSAKQGKLLSESVNDLLDNEVIQGVIATDIENKLNAKEQEYAPRLSKVEKDLIYQSPLQTNIGERITKPVITFIDDDGHVDVYNRLMPIFKSRGLSFGS